MPRNGEILAERLRNSEFVALEDVGHLVAVEKPLETADRIRRFARIPLALRRPARNQSTMGLRRLDDDVTSERRYICRNKCRYGRLTGSTSSRPFK